MDSLHYIKCN